MESDGSLSVVRRHRGGAKTGSTLRASVQGKFHRDESSVREIPRVSDGQMRPYSPASASHAHARYAKGAQKNSHGDGAAIRSFYSKTCGIDTFPGECVFKKGRTSVFKKCATCSGARPMSFLGLAMASSSFLFRPRVFSAERIRASIGCASFIALNVI